MDMSMTVYFRLVFSLFFRFVDWDMFKIYLSFINMLYIENKQKHSSVHICLIGNSLLFVGFIVTKSIFMIKTISEKMYDVHQENLILSLL